MNLKQINNLEKIAYLGLFLGVLAIALMPINSKSIEKIRYCHIDSISIPQQIGSTPSDMEKYWTDCGLTLTTKNKHKLGDSIRTKTIIFE